jgi:hypothetical protein
VASFLKLRRRKIVVSHLFFENDDDVVSYKDEERSWHIMKRQIGEEGDYNIMGDETFQEIVKSTHTLKDGGKIILSDGLGAVVQVRNFMIMVTRDVSPRAYKHKHEQMNARA